MRQPGEGSPTVLARESEALAATIDSASAGVDLNSIEQSAVSFSAPQQVGRFVLLRLLGAGAMGAVYAAYDERLERRVAIKLLHETETASELQRQRVLREAQAMARVAHPNVVSIFEVGEVAIKKNAEQVFIAMEYVEGMTLTQWQRQRARPWPEILRMYLAAGNGLQAAHDAGLIHRDFKADNVLVGHDDRPRVADFGLARLGLDAPEVATEIPAGRSGEGLSAPLTIAGAIAGTPGYMSPEQFRGSEVDARSDQFSFCAALYEALYGHLPFFGTTLAELAQNTLEGKLRPPPTGSPVPIEIHQALVRGLSTDPARRFSKIGELLQTLRLEHGDTAAAAGGARRNFLKVFVIAIVTMNFMVQYSRRAQTLSLWQTLSVDVTLLGVMLVVGALARKTLLQNAFHRRFWLACVIYSVQKIGLMSTAIHFQFPFVPMVALDLMILAGFMGLISLLLLPSLWGLVLFLGVMSCLTSIFGKSILWLSLASYSVTAGSLALAWNAAASQARRELMRPAE